MTDQEKTQKEFDTANFRIEKLAGQRNAALDQVILLQEQLEQSRLELRKAYARIAELLPDINCGDDVCSDTHTEKEVKKSDHAEEETRV